jgi:hygromycin-B 7''-O-kinase
VFVRPNTHEFVGIIDFGDAYISHPALDWRWTSHADRLAVLAGYCEVQLVSDNFMAAWHSLLVLSDMSALATWPHRQNQMLERLGDLLASLG